MQICFLKNYFSNEQGEKEGWGKRKKRKEQLNSSEEFKKLPGHNSTNKVFEDN